MRGGEIQFRADWNDAAWVDGLMTAVIVPADVIEVHGLGDARQLEQIPSVAPEVRIIDQSAQIAFEMAEVDGIETNQGGEETPVGFYGPVAE